MFRLSLILLLYLSLTSLASASGTALSSALSQSTSEASIEAEQVEFLKVDEAFVFSSETSSEGIYLRWNIAPDYYLYKERFKFKLLAPELKTDTIIGTPEYSQSGKAKEDPYFGLVHVIHDQLEIFLPVSLPNDISEAEIKVSYQGCAEAGLCYPPKHQTLLFMAASGETNESVTGSKPSNSTPNNSAPTTPLSKGSGQPALDNASSIFSFIQDSDLSTIIGIFFLLGIGLTFTPCVFPMIPIITSIIAGQDKPTTGKSFTLALAYVFGMAITYAGAGVVTGLLGASANVQAALQDPVLIIIFSSIFVLLALAMFGLYELQLPAFIRDRLNTTSQNLSGGHMLSVFFIGALSALVVSPCVSAPLAGALLYISTTGDAIIGGTSLFALGLGMGVPLILIAVGGGKYLPRAGAWMDTIKHVFGVMLVAVAVWLISRVIPANVSLILWSVLIGLVATQMGAFDSASKGWPRLFKGLGLLLALYSASLLIGGLSGATDPLKPLGQFGASTTSLVSQSNSQSKQFVTITDQEGLNKELLVAQQQNKPVLVDFYADWCISCKVMEAQVFPLPDIASKMAQFHLIKADVTANSEQNQSLMNQFNLFGPPSILFFRPNGEEVISERIVGEISVEAYRDTLNKVLNAI